MIARTMKAREELIIFGIDMSRAFDTIDRLKPLVELHNTIDEDCWKMVKILLEKTSLQAKIGHALYKPFETCIDATQEQLATVALKNLWSIWSRKKYNKIILKKRL